MVDGTDVCLGLLVNTKRIEKTVCHRELCHVLMLMVTAKVNWSDTMVSRSAGGPREELTILTRVSQGFPTIRLGIWLYILSKTKEFCFG